MAAAEEPGPGASTRIELRYRELTNCVATFNVLLVTQNPPFLKEPPSAASRAVRGKLLLGADELKFIWDRSGGKLYLDLNGNGDLSDDPTGALKRGPGGYADYNQNFIGATLAVKTALGKHPALINLSFYGYRDSVVTCTAEWRSFWEGKASLQGRDWQIGLVDGVSQSTGGRENLFMYLRPWSDRDQPFRVDDESLRGFAFPENFYLNNEGYRVGLESVPVSGTLNNPQLVLQRADFRTGDLAVTGEFVERLVLTGTSDNRPVTVLVTDPAGSVRAPAGAYNSRHVLAVGNVRAAPEARSYGGKDLVNIKIQVDKAAKLDLGGPLTNLVHATKTGGRLDLSYRLVGANGRTYQLLGPRTEPKWAAALGEKKLASGKFEFG